MFIVTCYGFEYLLVEVKEGLRLSVRRDDRVALYTCPWPMVKTDASMYESQS
jgi:hypothetical protein